MGNRVPETGGKRRGQGIGIQKWDPKPGSVAFYKANLPDRFNNTMLNIKSGLEALGRTHDQRFYDEAAARVLRWNEMPLSKIPFPLPDKCFACGGDLIHKKGAEDYAEPSEKDTLN